MKHYALYGWALCLLLASCAHGPYTSKQNPDHAEARGETVVFLDKDVRRTLSVDTAPIAFRSPAGQLSVQASLRNRTNNETLHLVVQTQFRDVRGAALYVGGGADAPWTPVTLSPNQTFVYTATSLNAEAQNFTIRVRYSKQPH
ncbi:MAG: hypothetical protein ACFCUX_07180 [Candidatus Methylacidiphilales bacterium]